MDDGFRDGEARFGEAAQHVMDGGFVARTADVRVRGRAIRGRCGALRTERGLGRDADNVMCG
jgi:hypothetical protein